MKIVFLLLPLVALAALVDMNASTVIDANIAHAFPYPIDGFPPVFVFLAMGLLAGRYPGNRRWSLLALFILVFAFALAGGMCYPANPAQPIAVAIMVSLTVSGGLVLSGQRPPFWLAASLFASLALVHGFAHGLQVSSADNAIRRSREIVTGTAILLLAGLSASILFRALRDRGRTPPALHETPLA